MLRRLLEFSAVSCARSDFLRSSELDSDRVTRYAEAGLALPEAWNEQLDEIEAARILAAPHELSEIWSSVSELYQEAASCELVIRVLGALLASADQVGSSTSSELVARNVLLAHLKFGSRLFRFVLEDSFPPRQVIMRLNGQRRRIERWSDVLVASLSRDFDVRGFAADEHRMLQFAREQREKSLTTAQDHFWEVILAGLRLTLPVDSGRFSENTRLHKELLDCGLSFFPSAAFSTTGYFKGEVQSQIERSSSYDSCRAREATHLISSNTDV